MRDWFEFGLKEGLTVFRDQDYMSSSSYMSMMVSESRSELTTRSRSLKSRSTLARIEAVNILREKQFREDSNAGTRTSVRANYLDLSNVRRGGAGGNDDDETFLDILATSTAYHKGAELFRMIETIVTKEGQAEGLRLYLERHDGGGATWDDF